LVDVPDLDLFPRRYPGVRSVEVYAALEIGAFHLALWGLSWLVRVGLIRDPVPLARPLVAVKRASHWLGSETGGMTVTLEGSDERGAPKRIVWYLVAGRSHGPYIPAVPSVMLTKRLLAGSLSARGAMPCVGLHAGRFPRVSDLDISASLADARSIGVLVRASTSCLRACASCTIWPGPRCGRGAPTWSGANPGLPARRRRCFRFLRRGAISRSP
jgi:hypothetical protein